MELPEMAPSTAPIGRLKCIQFSLLSEEQIKNMSVTTEMKFENGTRIQAGVFEADTDPNKFGGVNDPRMGTLEFRESCKTCKGDGKNCPGHFGHIELASPVFHIGFFYEIAQVLDCVCYKCSKLRLHKDDPELRTAMRGRHQNRLRQVQGVCKKMKECNPVLKNAEGDQILSDVDVGCHHQQPKYSIEKKKLRITAKFRGSDEDDEGPRDEVFTAERVYDIFKNISEDDSRIMGFNQKFARPEWMILRALPVPPPHVRPSVMGGSGRCEDDLTHKIINIITTNNKMKDAIERGDLDHKRLELDELMQYHVATLFDNEINGVPPSTQKSGRPLKTIRQRLKGKEGRVRGNLMGKRVDFSARSVITPDPNLALDQVGVPRTIALNLTFPERVTRLNINKMHALVANGPRQHPGANFVRRPDGSQINLKHVEEPENVRLDVGYVVERHIVDDDIVLFNRQPSLHKMSIMGHRVKVLPYSTFRLNLSVTSPYNADFDGDEMNLHVPQTHQARAEVNELMMVHKNIVSAQSNRPVMGIIQDTLMAVQKYTKRDNLLERDMVFNLLLWTEGWKGRIPKPAILVPDKSRTGAPPRGVWTGKQLFSMLLPEDLNMRRYSTTHPDDETDPLTATDTIVRVEDGILLSGVVDKNTVGKGGGGVIHTIMNEKGPLAARTFIGSIQKQINYWLLHRGFTVGVSDTVADRGTLQNVQDCIKIASEKVQKFVNLVQEGKLKTTPGKTVLETFEASVLKVLDKARDDAGTFAERSLDERNNIKAMVTAGSKGSFVNIAQIIALVGQQAVSGGRIPYGFRKRSLPHFPKDDLGDMSRGFVKNSYLNGLTPTEFFFHAMGGREGLIDTAVKTSETGYIQRRLVKSMEDVLVTYNGTVMNSEGMIVQFLYGEDGMDGRWIEGQSIDLLKGKDSDMRERFAYDPISENLGKVKGLYYLTPEAVNEIRSNESVTVKLTEEFEQLKQDREMLYRIAQSKDVQERSSNKYYLPVNVDRLVWYAQKRNKIRKDISAKSGDPEELRPLDIVKGVKELLKRCIIVVGQDDLSREAQQNATTLFQILIRCKLASKRVLRDYRLNKKAFEELLGQIEAKFNQAIVSPNEMVGVVAAQSIGEPTTQMTLNTFHYAGVGSKGKVTMGVPRLKEIINVTERMKTPSLTIYPVDSVRKDKSLIEKMHSHLAYTTLGDIVRATEIWYDPDPLNTVVGDEDEKRMVKFDIEVGELDVNTVSPWLLRIELFKQEVLVKNIEMDTIRNRIKEELDEDLVVIASEIGSDNLVLRIRCKRDVGAEKIMGDDDDGGNDDDDIPDNNSPDRFLAKVEEYLLKNLNIVGTKGISKAYYRHDKTNKSWDIEKGFSKDEEWVLSTDGTNLIETLNDENVDHARTVSNDIAEIFKVLGIEAVRRALVNEIRGTIASSGGGYINYRHLSVLVDSMTIRGYVMPITRHGLLSTNYGDLMKSSYEQTVEVLLKASALAQVDRLKGPTQNIMLGQTCPMGTGDMDCILDEEMLSSIVRTGNGIMTDDQIGISGISGAVPMTPGDNPTPLQADNLDQIMTSPVGMDDDDEMEFSPTNSPFFAGSQTPVGVQSPGVSTFGSVTSPGYDASVTPIQSPFNTPGYSGMSAQSPGYTDVGGRSPYLPQSPGYSSSGGSSSSPAYTGSIQSPVYSPTGGTTSGTSSLSSGTMGNKSTQYDPTSPAYSPMETGGMSSKIATTQSPSYSPMSSLGGGTTSPAYSPSGSGTNTQSQNDMSSSPAYSPFGGSDAQSGSTQYSPMSPAYTDQGGSGVSSNHFSTSPAYSPKSPFSNVAQTGSVNYSPMSPAYMDGQSTTGGAPAYSPQSPAYLGGNDVVVGDDTKREPTSPAYSPLSPGYQ